MDISLLSLSGVPHATCIALRAKYFCFLYPDLCFEYPSYQVPSYQVRFISSFPAQILAPDRLVPFLSSISILHILLGVESTQEFNPPQYVSTSMCIALNVYRPQSVSPSVRILLSVYPHAYVRPLVCTRHHATRRLI